MNATTLKELLAWLMSAPGAGAVAYWLIGVIPALEALAAEPKRYVALALTAACAVGAWALSAGIGLVPMPEPTVAAWLDAVVGVILVAIIGNQALHARRVLSKRVK